MVQKWRETNEHQQKHRNDSLLSPRQNYMVNSKQGTFFAGKQGVWEFLLEEKYNGANS
jgi:hypothetical protein